MCNCFFETDFSFVIVSYYSNKNNLLLQQLDLIFKFMCNAKLYRAGNLFRYQFAIFFARIQISGCLRIFDMNSHPVCMSSSKINYYLSMQKNHIHIAVALLKTCLLKMILITYTKSLVNTNLFYTNFTNTHFKKVPIPHLTHTMKQKFLH